MQFPNKKALDTYINRQLEIATAVYKSKLIADGKTEHEAMISGVFYDVPDDYIVECLTRDGYDLDDLTANGDPYEIGGHTNDAHYGRSDRNAAEKILVLRRKYSLTQRALSELTGIPLRTIENWEGEKNMPKDYVLRLLEKYLEVTLSSAEENGGKDKE